MVENAVQSISHALTTIGGPDPCITSQGKLDIRFPRHDFGGEVEKHHPHHDIEDPQDCRRILQTEHRIRSQGRIFLLPPRR